MRSKSRGFTLVELMVTVVIIAILSAIAVPAYRSYVQRSKRSGATSALLRIQASQEKFFLQNNAYSANLVGVPPAERAPILSEYVRVATSGHHHLPVAVGAPLSEFQTIADRYPVYRIDPSWRGGSSHSKVD